MVRFGLLGSRAWFFRAGGFRKTGGFSGGSVSGFLSGFVLISGPWFNIPPNIGFELGDGIGAGFLAALFDGWQRWVFWLIFGFKTFNPGDCG